MVMASPHPTLAGQQPLHGEPVDARAQRTAHATTTLVLSLLLAGVVALVVSRRAEESSAIHEIPAAQRALLYESTRRALETGCRPATRPAGLEDYCDAQARFIVQFEECGTGCRALAQQASRQPHR